MGYGQSSSPLDSIKAFIKRGGMPVSYTLIGINIFTFLFGWFYHSTTAGMIHGDPADYLTFSSALALQRPWTFVTYPLIGLGILDTLFNAISMWFIGGSLERSWGSVKFSLVLACMAAVSALSMQLISILSHGETMLVGFYYPVSSLTVVFCLLNSEVSIRPYGLFTIRAKYIAIIIPVWIYFTAGFGAFYNFIALAGCGAAYLYYKFGRSYSYLDVGYRGRPTAGPDLRIFNTNGKRTQQRQPSYMDGSSTPPSIFNVPAQIKSWQEKRRLERIFRKSGLEDTDPDFRDSDSDNKR